MERKVTAKIVERDGLLSFECEMHVSHEVAKETATATYKLELKIPALAPAQNAAAVQTRLLKAAATGKIEVVWLELENIAREAGHQLESKGYVDSLA